LLRFQLITREAEQAIAARDAATIAKEFRGHFLTGSDDRTAQVVRVGQRVAQATDALFPPPRLFKLSWKFNVIDSPEKQAVVLPGGQVFVFTGLLDELKTDHALAAVLSHQAAHMLLSHDAEKMSLKLVRSDRSRCCRSVVELMSAAFCLNV
jgi:predicted Zn-dependent protease